MGISSFFAPNIWKYRNFSLYLQSIKSIIIEHLYEIVPLEDNVEPSKQQLRMVT